MKPDRQVIDKLIELMQRQFPDWQGVMVSVCGTCRRIYGVKDACGSKPDMSHGSCPECSAKAMKSFAKKEG